jgi:preprotein translocase subunit SecF
MVIAIEMLDAITTISFFETGKSEKHSICNKSILSILFFSMGDSVILFFPNPSQ